MEFRQIRTTKTIITLIPLIFVLLVMFAAHSNADLTKAESSFSAMNPMESAGIYAKHCVKCHGADGHGKTPKGKQTNAPDLAKSAVSDAKGIRTIAKGKGMMPGFSDTLSAEEIQSVMGYVKGFRQ